MSVSVRTFIQFVLWALRHKPVSASVAAKEFDVTKDVAERWLAHLEHELAVTPLDLPKETPPPEAFQSPPKTCLRDKIMGVLERRQEALSARAVAAALPECNGPSIAPMLHLMLRRGQVTRVVVGQHGVTRQPIVAFKVREAA